MYQSTGLLGPLTPAELARLDAVMYRAQQDISRRFGRGWTETLLNQDVTMVRREINAVIFRAGAR